MDGKTSETDLLQASLAGDKEAFGLVVRRYQTLVCAVTYSATGDVGESEELAQEAFVRAWRNLRQLDKPDKFRAWICTIARNLAHTSVRGRRGAAGSFDAAATLPAATPGPEAAASDKERQEIVWAAVGRVPEKYREPLVLFYRHQQSVSEVAADLGLSEDTVRQRLHRGRQLIKAEVSSLVEDTLAHSGPGRAFAVAVVAALPALITPPASAAVVGIVAKGAPAAKTLTAAGLAGAVLGTIPGPILGAFGGLFDAWRLIKHTRSSRERWLLIGGTLLVCMAPVVFIGIPLALFRAGVIPEWFSWTCFVAFFVFVGAVVHWAKTRQKQIQVDDGAYSSGQSEPARVSSSTVRGIFGGCILAATIWLLALAWLSENLASAGGILAFDILLFVVVTAIVPRDTKRYWSAVILTVCALGAGVFAIVSLRWPTWMSACRQPTVYNPKNGVSVWSINLIVLSLYVALALAIGWSYATSRRRDDGPDRKRQA